MLVHDGERQIQPRMIGTATASGSMRDVPGACRCSGGCCLASVIMPDLTRQKVWAFTPVDGLLVLDDAVDGDAAADACRCRPGRRCWPTAAGAVVVSVK